MDNTDDPGNPKATSTPNDKIYGITNIKSYVPLLLDLDRLNMIPRKSYSKLIAWATRFSTTSKALLPPLLIKT